MGAQESTGIPAAVRQQATRERTLCGDRTCSQAGETEGPTVKRWLVTAHTCFPSTTHALTNAFTHALKKVKGFQEETRCLQQVL